MISEELLLKTLSEEITFSNNEDYKLEYNYRFNDDFRNFNEKQNNLIDIACLESDIDAESPSFLLKKRKIDSIPLKRQPNRFSLDHTNASNNTFSSSPRLLENENLGSLGRISKFNTNTSFNSFNYLDNFDEYQHLKAIDTNYHSSTSLPFVTEWNEEGDNRAWSTANKNYFVFDFLTYQSGIDSFKGSPNAENELNLMKGDSLDLNYKVSNFSLSKNKASGNPVNSLLKYLNNESVEGKEKEKLETYINAVPEIIKDNKKLIFTSQKLSNASCSVIKPPKKSCCSCKKSHCLKLYCECFKKLGYCQSCSCPNCLNNEKFEEVRQESINHLKCKNKHAFQSVVIIENNNSSTQVKKHIKGCKCVNSSCQKNYCECYQYGLSCTDSCKCLNCKNGTCEGKN